MLVRVQLPEPCLLSSMAEHVLGTDEAAGSVPAGGFMRMWRSGNASPCRGEDPGPIPGIRSRGALDQLAGVTALRPQECGFESRGRYSWPCDRVVQVPACKAGDVGSNPAEASRLALQSGPAGLAPGANPGGRCKRGGLSAKNQVNGGPAPGEHPRPDSAECTVDVPAGSDLPGVLVAPSGVAPRYVINVPATS